MHQNNRPRLPQPVPEPAPVIVERSAPGIEVELIGGRRVRFERLDPDQLALGPEDIDADLARTEANQVLPPESNEKTESGGTSRRPTHPDHLPRQDVTLDVESDACPGCGGRLHLIGEVTSEILDWVPAQAMRPAQPPPQIRKRKHSG